MWISLIFEFLMKFASLWGKSELTSIEIKGLFASFNCLIIPIQFSIMSGLSMNFDYRMAIHNFMFLDSPSTTSSTTSGEYKEDQW